MVEKLNSVSLIFLNLQRYCVHAEKVLHGTYNQTEDIFIEVILCSESVVFNILVKACIQNKTKSLCVAD